MFETSGNCIKEFVVAWGPSPSRRGLGTDAEPPSVGDTVEELVFVSFVGAAGVGQWLVTAPSELEMSDAGKVVDTIEEGEEGLETKPSGGSSRDVW